MNIWVNILAGLLIIVGTLGAILPILPGLPLAWVGLFVYAWSTDFTQISVWMILIFALLTAVTVIVDITAPALAAKGKKASRSGALGALIGGFVGVFTLGPIGIILGPFLGAFIGEMMYEANAEHAWRIAWASMLGLVVGSVFKLAVGFSMFIYFLFKVF